MYELKLYIFQKNIYEENLYDPELERNLSYKIKAEVIKKLHFIKITNSQASENAVRKGGISENGRVKNLLKENTDRNCQNQLVFRTLKINQRLVVIWETFIEEKQLNISKNNKFYSILTCLFLILFPQICSNLETNNPVSEKTSKEGKQSWSSFKAPFPENCHYLIYLVNLTSIILFI